jgi:Inositol polyphosphate kinase
MQSFPNLKKKIGDDKRVGSSSLNLRKMATSITKETEVPELALRRRYSSGNIHMDAQASDPEEHAHSPVEDEEDKVKHKSVPTYKEARQNWAERCYNIERRKKEERLMQGKGNNNVDGMKTDKSVNSEEPHTRTEWFLLIENLTKNMLRPCVLDLKMGTRQYG